MTLWRFGCAVVICLCAVVESPGQGEEEPGSIDHAGIIRSWDGASLRRGAELYNGICITCHGNLEVAGTLPTSRPFWKEPFKNGKDPLSIYKTLSDGFGQMPAWTFLTPTQRYDLVHFIREEFVKPHNPAEYFEITPEYLKGLPVGTGRGIKTAEMLEFEKGPPYLRMNFGPALFWTMQAEAGNIAQKGITVRLDPGKGGVSKGSAWMLYEHDTLRVAAGWTGDKFVDWRGIAFDGSHGTHTSIVGRKAFVNPDAPGWANPQTGGFEDPRFRGLDGRPYGPLPKEWGEFTGLYHHGDRVVLSYRVGDAGILEMPGEERSGDLRAFTRTLNIGRSSRDLLMRVAPEEVAVALAGESAATLAPADGFTLLRIPKEATPLRVKVLVAGPELEHVKLRKLAADVAPAGELEPLTHGGPARWNPPLATQGKLGSEDGAFAVDELTVPPGDANPWQSWMRFGGFDFFEGGTRAAICTWNGDVWLVSGIDAELQQLTWKRIASGLFQPLGVKIVDGIIHVTCRDQIARLHDLNGDEEIDFIENLNSDHQVTEHFHEFAMGLERDAEGNFYYAKSARHALPPLVPHHGTLLKVSADGSRTEIVASGFRAANGVCINDDGSFFVTDQEGHWIPKNRINRVRPGGFYGNMWSYHHPESSADEAMENPMVWITNEMDRSPAELRWVTSGKWGPLRGSLLNFSYGTGQIFLVPHEQVNGKWQGGVVALPIPNFPTGVMRARFNPGDHELYACGMFAWAGNQTADGGFYRIRYTGKPLCLPVELHARARGMKLKFTEPLDRASAEDASNYQVRTWTIKRTGNYGSKHHNERELRVANAELDPSGMRLMLHLPEIEPTRSMEIKYTVRTASGREITQRIHNTIHDLAEE